MFGCMRRQNTQPQIFDFNTAREKATNLSNTDKRLSDYVLTILDNPKFQKNPNSYMKKWQKERGHTEKLRIPDDLAHGFISKYFSSLS